jgi:ribosome maturation factor RimP
MADVARLTEVIEPEARALGFELVRVKLGGLGEERTLQVMAEDPATGQLVVEQCMALSRRISARIDAIEEGGEELVSGAYNLEVSSPGIDRPLTRPSDYADWAGHQARIKLHETLAGARQLSGIIRGIDQGIVLLATPKGDREIPFESIASAKLLLTDELIKATAPLDADGADLIKMEG